MIEAFRGTRGPRSARIMVIGEAWGAKEAEFGRPFMGFSGVEIERMLGEAGIDHRECFFTNVINARPDKNDFTQFLIPNSEAKSTKLERTRGIHPTNLLAQGLEALAEEIRTIRPKIIIALGNWPLWALTDCSNVKTDAGYRLPTGIDSWRGSHLELSDRFGLGPIPLLPTYHPAAILRAWSWRHIVVHDLRRAANYLSGKLPWHDTRKRDWIIQPSVTEVRKWVDALLATTGPIELVLDLETKASQIHIIGLKHTSSCLCVPFIHVTKEGTRPVYSSLEFQSIYSNLRRLLTNKRVRLVGQNLVYDAQYLRRYFHYEPVVGFDDMVAQYLLFPIDRKGLDYLASIYCRYYRYWKDERKESIDNESTQQACEYNCLDLEYTFECAIVLRLLLQRAGKEGLFTDRIELLHILLDMMARGVLIDLGQKRSQRAEMDLMAGSLAAWMDGALPQELKPMPPKSGTKWYDSSSQLMTIFYDTLKMRPVVDAKTGRRTLDKEALEELSEKYPIFKALFGALVIYRSSNTIANNILRKRISEDGRVRCAYSPAATASMRLNSTENVYGDGWNMQNVPRDRDDELTLFNAIDMLS